MSVANGHFFVLAPSMAILFLAGLLGICWLNQRQQRFLLWQSFAYSSAAIPIGYQSFATLDELNRYAVLIGALYLLGAWFLAKSWAERWKVSTRPGVALIIGAATLAALLYHSLVDQDVWARVHSFSIGSGLVLLLPISEALKKERSKDWLDQALFWSALIFTVFTIARPSLIALLGYTDLRAFVRSPYWLITLMSILLFALLFTFLMGAIAFRESVQQLRKERDCDALTQILNRRAFHEAAQLLLADRRMYPVAVLAGDIDHFKYINDSWGHDRGDQVLQLVSATLQRNVRSHDLVARFGGEEFVLLLARIDLPGAEDLAQRIRAQLSADNTLLQGARLTISFGIAPVTGPDQLESALKQADELLYDAKKAGRDRVHTAGILYPDLPL